MNNGPNKMSGPWKHYASQDYKNKKKFPAIQVGDRFHRLTVIEVRLKKGFDCTHEIILRCECNALVTTSPQSLRKKYVTACRADMKLEKKYAREIEMAKEFERLTSPHVPEEELPQRPKWVFAGAEDELIQEQEKQDVTQ